MASEYIVYADESIKQGKYFSNFYGGALVRSKNFDDIRHELEKVKAQQNLYNEIKWSKITEQYLAKYAVVVDRFFDFVEQDQVKIRIMFTQNRHVPVGLTPYQQEHEYFMLYYQFLKHAFGWQYANTSDTLIPLRLYLDRLPDEKTKVAQFRAFLVQLNDTEQFVKGRVYIKSDQIAEVSSHDHVILQCLDIVMGAIQFRLNDKHLDKGVGEVKRGKKTIAKETIYKQILQRIQRIYPGFNIGISTGIQKNRANRWHHPYRHWLFIPREFELDTTKHKPTKR